MVTCGTVDIDAAFFGSNEWFLNIGAGTEKALDNFLLTPLGLAPKISPLSQRRSRIRVTESRRRSTH